MSGRNDIVVDESNADLTTEQPAATNAPLQYPLVPVDEGTYAFERGTGRELFSITPAAQAAIEKWCADKEREDAEHQKYWADALALACTACNSAALLKDIRE